MSGHVGVKSGRVKSVTEGETVIELDNGHELTLPRYLGESPRRGAAVVVDFSSGDAQIFPAPPLMKVSKQKRYMNFNAVEKDGTKPTVEPEQKPMKRGEGKKDVQEIAQYSLFGFADTPYGARTLTAGNGNLCFASPTAVGMATSCSAKFIIRDDGTSEFVTPHYMALEGRTIVISSFHDNLKIEIDISSSKLGKSPIDFTDLKEKLANFMVGKDIVEPMTYEEAFLAVSGSAPEAAFLQMFGLHLAELLVTFKWERLLFRGNEQTFHEVFGSVSSLDAMYQFCQDCYNTDSVAELEVFLIDGLPDDPTEEVNVPSCEDKTYGTIGSMGAVVGQDFFEIFALNMTLKDGTVIEYNRAKRVYSLSHGIMASHQWTSSNKGAIYCDNYTVNIDSLAFPDLTVSPSAEGFCGGTIAIPTITWGGDFNLNVLGDASITAAGDTLLYGGGRAIIGGGSKGILIDSSGSAAITL